MTSQIIIHTAHGGMVFTIAYFAAFLTAAGIMLCQGTKRGYPTSTWMLILVTGVVFFIIGEKTFNGSPHDWLILLTGIDSPAFHEKNALGGILGLLAGIMLAKAILGFKRPVFDNLAIGLPVALAISRIGCMFAGCCYGIPSAMPFGIRYDQGSIAWDVQYTHGLIDLNAPASLAIHPVQLYQVAGCLFIAFIVWRSGHHWRASGSKFLFSVLCYGLLRFFIEFLVDPSSNSFAAELLWGLNLVQWIIVAVFCTGFIVLLIRESGTKPGAGDLESAIVPGYRRFLLAGMLCLMACMGRQWFDLLEITTISLFLIPVLFMMLFEVYKHLSVAGSRFVMPAILICCTCFMAQKSQPSGKENEKIVFAEAGLIGLIGQYYEEVSKVQNFWSDAGCTSLQDLGPSRRQFWQTGFDVSRNTWVGQYRKRSFGARLFIGSESGTIKTDYPRSELYLGISPYVNFDWKVFGFGAGFSLGQMKFPIGTKNLDSYRVGDIITVDYNNVYFMPALNARFGPVDILYAEASFPGLFPSAVPYPFFRAGVGSGLGRTNGTKAAIGYCDGIYAMIKYPVKEKLVLEALYADNLRTGTGAKRMLSVGVSYRFPSQRKPSTTDH